MKKLFVLMVSFLGVASVAWAVTTGQVPYKNASGVYVDSAIYSNGTNVGINSTSPAYLLDVAGTTKALRVLGVKGPDINWTDTQAITATSATFADGGTNYFGNNVGIGSSVPQTALDISGNIYSASGNIGLGSVSPTAKFDMVTVGTTVATKSIVIKTPAGSSILDIGDSGRVGIGTSVPATRLEVGGQIYSTVFGSSPSTGSGIVMRWNGAVGEIIAKDFGGSVSKPLNLQSTSGNVGVNSSAPGQKLDVVGSVRATKFYGDGNGLTNVATSGINWTDLKEATVGVNWADVTGL